MMNTRLLLRPAFAALAILLVLPGCSRLQRPQSVAPDFQRVLSAEGTTAKVVVPAGQAASVGTYKVYLESPSGKNWDIEYERDGSITNVWLADLVGDPQPELIVTTTSAGSGSYGSAAVFRLEGDNLTVMDLAPLAPAQTAGYMGHDRFEITNGRLIRRFPLYRQNDPNARPTGSMVELQYDFENGGWVRLNRSDTLVMNPPTALAKL